jgi:hypothetical protein
LLYVQLDTNWPDHHKIIEAGVDGAGAHAIVLCLGKRLEKDGWVRRAVLRRYGIDADLIDRLVSLELLEADDVQVRPWGWLDRNPSQAAIEADRAAKKEAGRRGNHAKWEHPGPFESCPRCNPKPQVVAECEDVRSGRIADDRTPTKQSESEVATAIAPDFTPPPIDRIPADLAALGIQQARELRERHLKSIGEPA